MEDDVDDANQRLQVLKRLESGELDVEQALTELGQPEVGRSATDRARARESTVNVSPVRRAEPDLTAGRWSNWWVAPFTIGVALTGTGIWLAQLGGWWWLLAGPLLLVGAPLTMLSLASTQSPWVHVRIHERHGRWPKTFGISLPIPARPAAWILRRLGSRIPQLRDTAVDELLLALDRGRYEGTPLHVEVDEGPNGERIEVYIG